MTIALEHSHWSEKAELVQVRSTLCLRDYGVGYIMEHEGHLCQRSFFHGHISMLGFLYKKRKRKENLNNFLGLCMGVNEMSTMRSDHAPKSGCAYF